ncbi:MarR family transcriptional regulator, partial [Bacillus cereus group sp. BceL118]
SGERDNIEVTLKALFMKSKSLLKDFPVALF